MQCLSVRVVPLPRLLLVLVLGVHAGWVQKSAAGEATPVTMPGAETHVYRKGQPEGIRLHVVKPPGWTRGDRRAALVFFFGGGWTRGTPEKSIGWARWAANLGLVGIAPDYRTKDRFGTSPLASVADGRAALRWVQEHAEELGISPSRIVVGGSSAGGHVALWTALKDTPPGSDPAEAPVEKPAALILASAVSDTSIEKGYTPTRFGTNAVALSPVHHLDSRMPPMLVFHGDADKTVPYSQSKKLCEALTASGNVCELVTVPGGDHSFSTQLPEWKERSRAEVKRFLLELGLLGGQPAAGSAAK